MQVNVRRADMPDAENPMHVFHVNLASEAYECIANTKQAQTRVYPNIHQGIILTIS